MLKSGQRVYYKSTYVLTANTTLQSRILVEYFYFLNTSTVRTRTRGLKVNEGVNGPNVVLFLDRSTLKKRAH